MEGLTTLYPLKLPPLSMTQASMVTIAAHLWKHSDIQNQLKKFLGMCTLPSCETQFVYCQKFSPQQRSVFDRIFQKINKLPYLPVPQQNDLKFVATQLGINLFQWLTKIGNENIEDLISNLQWDNTGCIDAAGIYRSLYWSGTIKTITLQRLIAMYECGLEDCIDDYWCKVPLKKRELEFKTWSGLDASEMVRYWGYYINTLSMRQPVERDSALEEDTLYILRNKVQPFYDHFQHFWIKPVRIQQCTPHLVQLPDIDVKLERLVVSIGKINCLMERMVETERVEFRRRNSAVLEKILVDVSLYWPWHNLFLTMIKKFHHFISSTLYYYILSRINEQSYMEFQILGSAKDYHYLTRELWSNTPRSVKLAMHLNPQFAMHVIDILRVNDIELLKEIFDDKDLSAVRSELIDPSKKHWIRVRSDKSTENAEALGNFIQDVLRSDQERQLFKNLLNRL